MSSPRFANKEMRELARKVRRAGFHVVQLGKHYAVADNAGQIVVSFSGTASDWRAMKNIEADLRRAGVEV